MSPCQAKSLKTDAQPERWFSNELHGEGGPNGNAIRMVIRQTFEGFQRCDSLDAGPQSDTGESHCIRLPRLRLHFANIQKAVIALSSHS